MLPRIKISRDCNYRISGELMRVFPREGIIIPLVSLNLRDNDANPCKVVRLSDVAEVVVADAVLVPRDRQVNGMARVSVLPNTDGPVNAEVERLTRRFPRLRPCAYLHSHPFAVGRTWPSRGPRCDYEGHMLPLLARNRQAGLETCFSFIACRSVDGSGWRIQCFALDNDEQIVDLGCAETVPNGSTEIRRALARGAGRRGRGLAV